MSRPTLDRRPLRAAGTALLVLALGALGVGGATSALAQPYEAPACPFRGSPSYPGLPGVCHPYPQPRPPMSAQRHFCRDGAGGERPVLSCAECPRGCLTRVDTGEGVLPATMELPESLTGGLSANVPPPFALPPDFEVGPDGRVPANPFNYVTYPGTNLLPTVYTDLFDGGGVRMPNTLPSTPHVPYALHPDPQISVIDPRSPEEDLGAFLDAIEAQVLRIDGARREAGRTPGSVAGEIDHHVAEIEELVRLGIDILEGNSLLDTRLSTRVYSGFPMLHYKGPEKVAKVEPIYDVRGEKIGGHVTIHQIWFGQRIESDVAFIDPSEVLDVPWTATYVVDTLSRGHDDFSPFAIFTDTPWFQLEAGGSGDVTWEAGDFCTVGGSDDERRAGGCERLPWQFVAGTKGPHGYGMPCLEPAAVGGEWTPPAGTDGRCAASGPPPHAGMDQTFFNMEEGTRTVFEIAMPPGDYLNLVYTWGWRMHPPRIQVMENALKKPTVQAPATSFDAPGPHADGLCPSDYSGCALPQLEQAVFCNPETSPIVAPGEPLPDGTTNTCSVARLPACTSVTDTEADKLYAIGRIGDLAPAKRLWNVLRSAAATLTDFERDWRPRYEEWQRCEVDRGGGECRRILERALGDDALWRPIAEIGRLTRERAVPAFRAWSDRTQLPCYERDPNAEQAVSCLDGLNPAPDSDITVLYVNNTTYGQLTAGGWVRWSSWETRHSSWRSGLGAPGEEPVLHVALLNGDHFPHAYDIADFGGNRGWENQFKSSVRVAGSGCWFTFGRAHFDIHTGGGNGFVCVPPAPPADGESWSEPSTRYFEITFNFEPSRRLRFYQFDPFHHDTAIYSIH